MGKKNLENLIKKQTKPTMALHADRKSKKEKEGLTEFAGHVRDIRQQLNDQLKCLEQRLETEVAIVLEMEDFFKKVSEIELEYGKNLDRLVKQINTKHKTEKQKREHWHLFSMYTCWQNLLNITKKQSHDHSVLGEICNNQMVTRLQDIVDNSQRIFKKC